jgi:hypothetical protein
MPGTGQDTEQEAVEDTEIETPEVETPEVSDKPESAEDTVRRAYAQLQGNVEEEPKEALTPEEIKELETQPRVDVPKGQEQPRDAAQRYDIKPPEAFNAEEKEAFNRYPKKMKLAIQRVMKAKEQYFTERTGQIGGREKEITDVEQAIKPYLADFGIKGVRPAQAIQILGAAHVKLVQDPDAGCATLIKSTGADINKVLKHLGYEVGDNNTIAQNGAQAQQQQAAPSQDIFADPRFQQLTNTIQEINNERISQREAARQEFTQSLEQEFLTVRDERDQFGKYRFPKLHEDAFIKQVEPVVLALGQTMPNLSWGDRLKRAYYAVLEGNGNQPNGYSTTTLPGTREHIERVKAANVSIRGKGGPVLTTQLTAKDIPNSATDTARLAYEMLKSQGA